MNSLLSDPFAQDYPESLLQTLTACQASCLRFSNTHIACGTISGDVVLYDLLTFGPARILKGHCRTVQSVTWSRCGRYILSASRDWLCILWDLSTSKILYKVQLDAPVWMADISPESPFVFCASLLDTPAVVVRCSPDLVQKCSLEEDASPKTKNQAILCTIFSPNGDYIIGGTSKGYIMLWSAATAQLLKSWRLTSGSIKSIALSSTAPPYLITNSTDRIIRTVALPEPGDEELETEHKFQDIVNRLQWHAACFSGNAEYVVASTYQSANDLYIWERQRGSLVKILEGPKEELVDVDWHPRQVVAAAVGIESGAIYLWGVRSVEKWGSFAPDFKELEENVEYEEHEDEFDILPAEETGERVMLDESADIDLETLVGDEEIGFTIPLELGKLEADESAVPTTALDHPYS
ncbi:protein of unknown function [Taphrina deformans PYCC 5710]|uniref:Uncharacterized protein n=1 Tax=Taphrina deformans (strain PYCC 5710 / ATCC 11124 / CBS 356.35 / IMI 108563 / JCM 9778 / NBRC 8474) TaxID=1097556 RepID=R4XNR2_TAPDE|nr:protein of unknown function [Taphrina deformans PYCC 5710]|eukprot:CCG84892.1 protein of unknown function [Taphrina deformans PYCC 5710]